MIHIKRAAALASAAAVALSLLSGCGSSGSGKVASPDWSGYDSGVKSVYAATDTTAREAGLHSLEDQLMASDCVVPIFYYTHAYMCRGDVSGIRSSKGGMPYFMNASKDGASALNIFLGPEPETLDPALNTTVDGGSLALNSFAGLYTIGGKGEPEQALVGASAVSDDGLTYTFELKKSAWSNGDALTAKDFVYSWNRAAAESTGAGYSYLFSVFARKADGTLDVTADDNTLVCKLSAPCTYLYSLLAFPTFMPVYEAGVKAADPDGKNPGAWALEPGFVCNGAYTLKTWKHGESMTYVKNPNYYDAANVKTDTLSFMLSDDAAAPYAAYSAGNLDYLDQVPTDVLGKLKSSGNTELKIEPELGTYYMTFNSKSQMFSGMSWDQACGVRSAISMMIDRQYICDSIDQSGAIVANTFIPPQMSDGHGGTFRANDDGYTYPDKEDVGYFDPLAVNKDPSGTADKARALLKAAGFKFGDDGKLSSSTPLSFTFLITPDTKQQLIAEAVQQDLSALGISITIDKQDWSVFLDTRTQGGFDLARDGWTADYDDPINMLEIWTTDSSNNVAHLG
jgi:peptide/nickel transport system substrate-binding protein/oligopeptide transport system substrate-binding protein